MTESRPTEATQLAAAVIAAAREDAFFDAPSAAAFDYGIGCGRPAAEASLTNALYRIANRGLDGDSDEKEARMQRLREFIAPELDAYRSRCRNRQYVGWSNASSGPIRYAD